MAFYLDVYSKSEFFTSNKAGNFRAQIHPAKTLKGRWEVSLVEARLPHALNLQEDAPYLLSAENEAGEFLMVKRLTIKKGYYSNYEDLRAHLRIPGVTIIYNDLSNKVGIKINKKYDCLLYTSPSPRD